MVVNENNIGRTHGWIYSHNSRALVPSPVDEGWYHLNNVLKLDLNFGIVNGPKKNWNSKQFILGLPISS